MDIFRLIYCSKPSNKVDLQLIRDILKTSRENNSELDVTGLLSFNSKYFLQCLEGTRANVETVYSWIEEDDRHSNLHILFSKEVNGRAFFNWSMAYTGEYLFTKDIMLEHSGDTVFHPDNFAGEVANGLVMSIADKVDEVALRNI